MRSKQRGLGCKANAINVAALLMNQHSPLDCVMTRRYFCLSLGASESDESSDAVSLCRLRPELEGASPLQQNAQSIKHSVNQ